MQIDGKIATVYAGALFELVADEQELDTIGIALTDLLGALQSDQKVWDYLSSPIADPENKVSVIRKSLVGQTYPVLVNFISLLAQRRRFDALPMIQSEFIDLIDQKLGRKQVLVQTAHKLSDTDVSSIQKVLSTYFNKTIQVKSELVPDLIGGLVINAGEVVIDTSMKSKLKRIKKQMINHKIFGETFYEN